VLGPKVPHYALASRRLSSDTMRGFSPAAVNHDDSVDDDGSFLLHKSAESESYVDARKRRKSHSANDAV